VHISAKVDYAVRALVALAAAGGGPIAGASLAQDQHLPAKFLEGILAELRRSAIVASQRGAEGGYRLARPAEDISIADILRAIDGPLAAVRGERPESVHYAGSAEPLSEVWLALRVSMRAVIEHVSLADVVHGPLPANVTALIDDPDAWVSG
jgi:Rrf2 family protein